MFVILNFAAVAGICAITLSGIIPFNFSNFKSESKTTGSATVSVAFPNNFCQLLSPTTPSAVSPFFDCVKTHHKKTG